MEFIKLNVVLNLVVVHIGMLNNMALFEKEKKEDKSSLSSKPSLGFNTNPNLPVCEKKKDFGVEIAKLLILLSDKFSSHNIPMKKIKRRWNRFLMGLILP